ncbi:uroporphyrin-III C-methyltransferase [Microlunatus soli]|uniref:uroporphyrinogen-III C-methyltransferase n=1 Tax=Microlunatus soli TaxID=630515 RepID=A0A1H1V6B5_9ACTN|nr:uroporphyrinogen-III C-methyltransferase [Microlunatus soli]SDS80278.1 uroporphyrin-III C-methyltransferase [Microlunatus soli]
MGAWRGFEVGGRRVAVVGTTSAGIRGSGSLGIITALLEAGADLLVAAAQVSSAVVDLAERRRLRLITAGLDRSDLDGTALVVVVEPGTPDAVLASRWADDHGVLRCEPEGSSTGATSASTSTPGSTGEVFLVGGGPGDPGLLTVAGLQAIKEADVIAADRLAPLAALEQARDGVEIIDVGKIPRGPGAEQRSIEDLLIDRARAGNKVVRFKGGDGFVFGRGGEEWQACAAAGIPVTVIPGVTSATAAPAAAGIPITHRTLSQGFSAVTGHVPPGDPRSTIDWPALARSGTTLVIMMGMANLAAIAETLIINGLEPTTPAAVIADGTMASMRVLRADLSAIADAATREGLGAPATVVIGRVAAFDPHRT